MNYWKQLQQRWARFAALPRRYTIGGGIALIAVILMGAHILMRVTPVSLTTHAAPAVTVSSVASLSSAAGPLVLVGKVTSLSQATILAQSSGSLMSLTTKLGAKVGAGSVLGSFENSSQRATVLQAQGAYDAAVAAQSAVSPTDARAAAVNAYTSAYSTLDTLLRSDVDTFFGPETAIGPELIITATSDTRTLLSRKRDQLSNVMRVYQGALDAASASDPSALLVSAKATAQQISDFLVTLAAAANQPNSNATASQLSALSTARTGVSTLLSTLTTAQQTYRSQSVSTTASTNASVTVALGGLRAAQASLEKTIVRATISGTIVSLPVHRGDFVSQGTTVAIISNPHALEVDTYVTSQDAKTIAVGNHVTINGTIEGTIVFVAPAIDPLSGKIQVKIGLPAGVEITDGDTVSVRVARVMANDNAASSAAPAIKIPLAAAKITPQGPVVFTVSSSTLQAHPVTLGTIVGDQVVVLRGVMPDMVIVTDARGFSDGQEVTVTETP